MHRHSPTIKVLLRIMPFPNKGVRVRIAHAETGPNTLAMHVPHTKTKECLKKISR